MENTFYIKGLFHWHLLNDTPMLVGPTGWDFLPTVAAAMRTDWAKYPHTDYTAAVRYRGDVATLMIGQGIGKTEALLQAYGRLLKTTKL